MYKVYTGKLKSPNFEWVLGKTIHTAALQQRMGCRESCYLCGAQLQWVWSLEYEAIEKVPCTHSELTRLKLKLHVFFLGHFFMTRGPN